MGAPWDVGRVHSASAFRSSETEWVRSITTVHAESTAHANPRKRPAILEGYVSVHTSTIVHGGRIVVAGEVEEVDSGKGDEETGDERDGVDAICGVHTLEEDEGGYDCSC